MPKALKHIASIILWFEPFVLIACIYGFWFNSGFVANTPLELPTETNWMIAVIVPLMAVRLLWGIWEQQNYTGLHLMCAVLLVMAIALVVLYADFTPAEDIDRADWMFLLLLFIPFCMARWIAHERLWTFTLMDVWLIAFLVLGVINLDYAPFTGRGIRMLARPALGIWCMIYLTEQVRLARSLRVPFILMIGLSFLVGWMALGATSWTTKSDLFDGIIDSLWRIDFFAVTGFNPNEIGGAMAWLAPLMAGVFVYFLTPESASDKRANEPFAPTNATMGTDSPPLRLREGGRGVGSNISQILSGLMPSSTIRANEPFAPTDNAVYRGVGFALLALLAFAMLLLALFLGQSRSAMIGVILALLGIALFATSSLRWRVIAVSGVALLIALQIGVFFNLFPTTDTPTAGTQNTGVSTRDERTVGQRFDIWGSAFAIVADYPLTGVGINNFRYDPIRRRYPVRGFNMPYSATEYDPNYQQRIIPHTHNEFVQMLSDMGIPGFIIFTGWHITLVYMLWVAWRKGDRKAQIGAIAIGAGLLAHGVYGMMDAIPLWDRFTFVYWLMVGLAVGVYVLVRLDEINKKLDHDSG